MSQQTIKRKLIENFRKKQEINREQIYLVELLDNSNDYLCDSFPYERSLEDQINAENNWCEKVIENLERAHIPTTYTAVFYNHPVDEEVAFTREIKAETLIDAKAEARKIAQETGTFYDVKEPEEE